MTYISLKIWIVWCRQAALDPLVGRMFEPHALFSGSQRPGYYQFTIPKIKIAFLISDLTLN